MPTASNIADWLVNYRAADVGAPIDSMSLEKHLFYAQGFHLVLRRRPLFADAIEAWKFGPVVSAVWKRYKKHGNADIAEPAGRFPDVDGETADFLREVVSFLSPFRSVQLFQATHEEDPWKTAWSRGQNEPISQDAIHDWFASTIGSGEEALSGYALLDVVPEPRWGWLYVAGICSLALTRHPFWATGYSTWNTRLWVKSPGRRYSRELSRPPTRAEAAEDRRLSTDVEELDDADQSPA